MSCADPLSLWWAPLDVAPPLAQQLAADLAPDERERAQRLRDPLDRARFTAARGWLRRLLAEQLSCDTGEVSIVADERGKPRLASGDLRFSASRSAAVALFATSSTAEVGVDVEAIRPGADLDGIAARFFSPAEQRALAALAPAQRLAASFDCWTRKEAYVKGTGDGLSFPLRTVEVWTGDRAPVQVSGWSIHQVALDGGFAAAVAATALDGWIPGLPRELGR